MRRPEDDAHDLRQRTMPDTHTNDIIIPHVNTMLEQARSLSLLWEQGQISPRVKLVTDYINDMFKKQNNKREIVIPVEAHTMYESYMHDSYAEELTGSGHTTVERALNLTAMSCMWYAVARVRHTYGIQLKDFRCIPIELGEAGTMPEYTPELVSVDSIW